MSSKTQPSFGCHSFACSFEHSFENATRAWNITVREEMKSDHLTYPHYTVQFVTNAGLYITGLLAPLGINIYRYIYIDTHTHTHTHTIYRHVFRCSTAHQCSLVQSGYGMATIYTQAIVSDNRLWDNSCRAHILRA